MSRVTLSHGDGGAFSAQLVQNLFLRYLWNPYLEHLSDATILPTPNRALAVTTDSFVVQPVFFPGGDIGKLSVCGTINDLTAGGARPLYLTAAFILEEGFLLSELEQIVASMAQTAKECDVAVVAGDTKVVPRGQADGIYINTTGIGQVHRGLKLSPREIKPGDAIIVSGTLGDHGIAVLSEREGLAFQTQVKSDCAPLSSLLSAVEDLFPAVRWLRDPTRGGVAASLNELAQAAGADIILQERHLPIRPQVKAAADMLGLDPLTLANEGKMVFVVQKDSAAELLSMLKAHPLGADAVIIGTVASGSGEVLMKTEAGGTRLVEMPAGIPVPRIC
ncbi:hydrogenase expression/formation protein HypE [Dethiobacter alkaliphilus]|uniref:hydrogenase expression/formation protein HypE n=1 Tax=Dethiobacter alkaliphilus TaxID=427926 RepID=UPI0022280D94|nr:hydrogenase expression/formation protein HypE [Dethiobacter alkaliphilus]MCW3490326.1 hydrogenase expression/formation protein HypE [Dethiobacter alkaliphilus]